MKKVILILGSNGVGKSTTAKVLLSKLSKAAYIDGDACRAINPFPFTKATKIAVMKKKPQTSLLRRLRKIFWRWFLLTIKKVDVQYI